MYMIVTQITELSKERSKVYIDQEFAFVLYKGELRLYRIQEGKELTADTYRTIMQEVLPKRAKLRAMNLLQTKEYTTAQLRRKLCMGFYPEDIVQQALDYVASYHYTDDLRYSVNYITCHEDDRSRRRIEQDLYAKGVDKATIENAWKVWEQQGGIQNEQKMIAKLLQKRNYDPEKTDLKEQQRLYAFLTRKGYSSDQIRKALGSNT